MSKLSKALQSGKFVVTGEVGPPKGVAIEEMLESAELYKGRVVAVNVTDQQSAVMRLGSLAVCHLLKDMGIETVFQVTCRDRNRIAIQSDLPYNQICLVPTPWELRMSSVSLVTM